MGLCDGFVPFASDTNVQITLEWVNLTLGVLWSLTSICTTIILFCKKSSYTYVPFFVKMQMVALIAMIPFSLTYYTLLIKCTSQTVQNQTFPENAVSTVEVFFLLVHEWLYTDQFFQAALWLNIDVRPQPFENEEEFYKERKRKIDRTASVLNYGYYIVLVGWTLASIYINEFAFRMS